MGNAFCLKHVLHFLAFITILVSLVTFLPAMASCLLPVQTTCQALFYFLCLTVPLVSISAVDSILASLLLSLWALPGGGRGQFGCLFLLTSTSVASPQSPLSLILLSFYLSLHMEQIIPLPATMPYHHGICPACHTFLGQGGKAHWDTGQEQKKNNVGMTFCSVLYNTARHGRQD